MAVPAGGAPTLILSGDVAFLAGGLPVTALTGAFVKGVEVVGTDLVLTVQLADGTGDVVTFAGGGGMGGGLTSEQVRDVIAAILTAGAGVSITYNDDGDNAGTLTIAGVALSDDAPTIIGIADGEAGVATTASRSDHTHRMYLVGYDAAQVYRKGDSIIEGSGADVIVWTASKNIAAGQGPPSLNIQRDWILNARVGAWKGNILINLSRTLNLGDWFRVGNQVYLVKTFVANAIGAAIIAPENVINLTAAGAVALSDGLPVNIGPQSQQGVGVLASRDDHTHYLPHDATLAFSDGALGVSIHDVVEHLSQRIQYYTNENNYDTDGSGAGQVYNSSRYPKNLQWVKAFIRVPLGVDDAIYRAGVYRVASDNEILEVLGQSAATGIITDTGTYRFDFLAESTSALGIPLDGGERIMVLIRRIGAGNTADTGLRHGEEDDDSPNASYPDAAVDFVLANHVIVQHENPAIGQTTHSHGGGIRGNLQLGYIVIIDHGSLVGDERNVNAAHIDSGAAADDEFLGNDGAGNALWKVPPSGGGGGGSDPETLFDNHPTLVQIGTLSANLTSTPTSLTLAALPTETVNTTDFLLIDSEVIDLSIVNGLTLSGIRGQRGTDAAVHLGGAPVYLLTTANGGLGRTLTTRSWVYGGSNQNAFDLGKALDAAVDDDKECLIEVEYDSNDARRYGAIVVSAQTIRELRSLARISTSSTHETFPLIMQRVDQITLTANAPMMLHFGRKRFDATDASNYGVTDGNDGLRLAIGMGGSAALMYRFYMRVRLLDSSGGAGGASGQVAAGGDGLTRISEVELLASSMFLTEYSLNTAWGAVVQSTAIEFLGFQPDEIDRIELGFNINASFIQLVTITRQNIEQMGIVNGIAGVAGTTIPGMYFSGRTIATTDSREPVELNPKLGWMNNRRLAGRYGVLIQLRHSDEGEINAILPYVSADTEIDAVWAYMVPRGAAV